MNESESESESFDGRRSSPAQPGPGPVVRRRWAIIPGRGGRAAIVAVAGAIALAGTSAGTGTGPDPGPGGDQGPGPDLVADQDDS